MEVLEFLQEVLQEFEFLRFEFFAFTDRTPASLLNSSGPRFPLMAFLALPGELGVGVFICCGKAFAAIAGG